MKAATGRSGARRIAAAVGAACMAVSLLAVAQPEASLPQVTVHGERTLTVERIGTSRTLRAPIERYTLARPVSYADLDLGSYEGRAELSKRIRATAIASCNELRVLAPLHTSEDPATGTVNQNCEKDAVDGAMTQANAAIATAMTGDEDGAS